MDIVIDEEFEVGYTMSLIRAEWAAVIEVIDAEISKIESKVNLEEAKLLRKFWKY